MQMWFKKSLQVFGRAAKYSLFDPSKEMVFITMDKQEKEAGKAAVDLLGNQIGKSGGSWVMQVTVRERSHDYIACDSSSVQDCCG